MRRPRPPRRRSYPLSAYLPFAIMVAVPIILLVVLVWLVGHALAPARTAPAAPTATPRPTHPALVPLATATLPATHPTGSPARASATPAHTPTSTPAITATGSVTIAAGATAAGLPVGAATIFHGSHTRLWAFATIPDVHAGNVVRFIWRDLDRNAVVENYPVPVQVNAARFQTRMYAYLGNAPNSPFPPDAYRVDVFRDKALVGSAAFRIVP